MIRIVSLADAESYVIILPDSAGFLTIVNLLSGSDVRTSPELASERLTCCIQLRFVQFSDKPTSAGTP